MHQLDARRPTKHFAHGADGTGGVERLTESISVQLPTSLSLDGAWLVFIQTTPGTGEEVMMLSLSEPLQTPADATLRRAQAARPDE